MTGLYANLCGVPRFRRERYDVARATMADADPETGEVIPDAAAYLAPKGVHF